MAKSVKEPKVPNAPKDKKGISSLPRNYSFLFPKINRFITESWKLIVVSFISGLILIGIVFQSADLYQNIKKQREIRAERGSVERELSFWKSQSVKYPDSRDVYFRIATLRYELGDTDGARTELQKSLDIDPNFKKGIDMKAALRF